MENEQLKSANKIILFLLWIKNFWFQIWESKKKAFYFLCFIYLFIFLFVTIYTACRGAFFHFNTDDILQYYPYISNLFDKMKSGTLSFYDTTLVGGTSIFGSVYYMPFDIFTLAAFLLSYAMEAETAYAMVNLLKPITGALLIYYLFLRKNMSVKTAFMISIIYFIGGMTEAYYIFPVYLGICFYVPLGMLLIDVCLDKKGYYYLFIPIYCLATILTDYYIAYMILAFFCIYFFIEMYIRNLFSLVGKNAWYKNKDFYKRTFIFFSFVLIGVLISCFFLLPSALYIVNESTRNNMYKEHSLWFFSKYNSETEKVEVAVRHYFTQWCNLFIPNEPFRLCLKAPGDYIREHQSLYMTSGGILYLVYFFFIRNRRANRLKPFVILFGIIYCMPIFAMIFTFNAVPYARWFFIPYMINLYAMAIGMNENDFQIGKCKYTKLIPFSFMVVGLVTLSFVLIESPDIFIHYTRSDPFFSPILIGTICLMSIYLAIILGSFIAALFKKSWKIYKRLMPVVISAECIFACVLIFVNVDNAGTYYYYRKDLLKELKLNVEGYGYQHSDGYRINFYNNDAKGFKNTNILIQDVNFGTYFQSFYNKNLNVCFNDIYQNSPISWDRNFTDGYTLLSANNFNVKYLVIPDNQKIDFPKYYVHLGHKNRYNYYELKDMFPFLIYDTYFSERHSMEYVQRELAILKYAYVKNPYINDETALDPKKDKDTIEQLQLYKRYLNSDMLYKRGQIIEDEYPIFSKSLITSKTEQIGNNNYFVYDLSRYENDFKDIIKVHPQSNSINNMFYGEMMIRDTEDQYHDMHYNVAYVHEYTPKELLVKTNNITINSRINLYSFGYEYYDDFLENQNQYTNKSFTFNNDEIHITCTFPKIATSRILKTGYTYSDDWKVQNENFETINVNGGFLGIVIPGGTESIDLTIKYIPAGYNTGCKLTFIGSMIYLGAMGVVFIIILRKRSKEYEVYSNHSALF